MQHTNDCNNPIRKAPSKIRSEKELLEVVYNILVPKCSSYWTSMKINRKWHRYITSCDNESIQYTIQKPKNQTFIQEWAWHDADSLHSGKPNQAALSPVWKQDYINHANGGPATICPVQKSSSSRTLFSLCTFIAKCTAPWNGWNPHFCPTLIRTAYRCCWRKVTRVIGTRGVKRLWQ